MSTALESQDTKNMAAQGGDSQEDLLQTAHSISEMLKQLKAANEEDEPYKRSEGRGGGSRGGHARRGGRKEQREVWSDKRGGRNERRGGQGRGRGNYRGFPISFGGYDRNWRSRDEVEMQSNVYHYHTNDWRNRESSYGDYGRDGHSRLRNKNYDDESAREYWQAQREVQDYPSGRIPRQREQSREVHELRVEPLKLVKALSTQTSFSASLLQLMEQQQLTPAAVRATVSCFPQVFHLEGEIAHLQPQLDICAEHCGPHGCQHRHTCSNLHLCPKMAVASCDVGQACVLGHNWYTDHNLTVLKPLYIDHLNVQTLRKLLQLMYAEQNDNHQGLLTVCVNYNQSKCDIAECDQLHICLSFVTRLTKCSRNDCQLNHDLLGSSCQRLLQQHGFSTNESPRDILIALLHANPSLKQADKETKDIASSPAEDTKGNTRKDREKTLEDKKSDSKKEVNNRPSKSKTPVDDSDREESSGDNSQDYVSSDEVNINPQKNTPRKSKVKSVTIDESSSNSSTESDEDINNSSTKGESEFSDESSEKVKNKNINQKLQIDRKSFERKKVMKKVKSLGDGVDSDKKNKVKEMREVRDVISRRTLWAHYLLGNVATPEICYYSVESMCKNEERVCPRLHASHHFHWQIRQQSNRWTNLRLNQVICLERAFCDPEQNGADLPRLDPATLDMSLSGLFILLGRDTWHADFPNSAAFTGFTLTNSAKTVTLELRRLCTESLPGQPTLPSKHIWYFLDKNKKWVKYGNVDTVGETNLVSSITSDDIEKHFQQTPTASLNFKNSQFSYTLDLQNMNQINSKTKVSRSVRRRPEAHLPNEQEEKPDVGQNRPSDLPSQWESMQDEERLRMVTLAPTSTEYQTAVGLLAGRVPSSNVVKVERIQNPYLWRAFQNKVKELTAVYGDASKVDVRQLFHGTSHNVISSICAENLDWRLHGSASGQSFGRGTYFSTDANYSYGYTRADPSGLKYMFIVKVAVGSITQGNSSMVRPPTNPTTSLPFDSTGNGKSSSNSSIIVKYDKQEYYPEYVLTLN